MPACDRQTDGQTDGRTDGTVNIARRCVRKWTRSRDTPWFAADCHRDVGVMFVVQDGLTVKWRSEYRTAAGDWTYCASTPRRCV